MVIAIILESSMVWVVFFTLCFGIGFAGILVICNTIYLFICLFVCYKLKYVLEIYLA